MFPFFAIPPLPRRTGYIVLFGFPEARKKGSQNVSYVGRVTSVRKRYHPADYFFFSLFFFSFFSRPALDPNSKFRRLNLRTGEIFSSAGNFNFHSYKDSDLIYGDGVCTGERKRRGRRRKSGSLERRIVKLGSKGKERKLSDRREPLRKAEGMRKKGGHVRARGDILQVQRQGRREGEAHVGCYLGVGGGRSRVTEGLSNKPTLLRRTLRAFILKEPLK